MLRVGVPGSPAAGLFWCCLRGFLWKRQRAVGRGIVASRDIRNTVQRSKIGGGFSRGCGAWCTCMRRSGARCGDCAAHATSGRESANLRQQAKRASPHGWTRAAGIRMLRGYVFKTLIPRFFDPCPASNTSALRTGKFCRLPARARVLARRMIFRRRTLPFGTSCSPGFRKPCGAPPIWRLCPARPLPL